MIQISPSLLAADFAHLDSEIGKIEGIADWLHLDIMDGHFVPNISFGIPVVRHIRSITQLPFDVHLMIERPEQYLAAFRDAGADMITVHAECCVHLHRTVVQIKELGCKAGVALNPHTSVDTVKHLLKDLDLVLVMTVNPGFGGQSFIHSMIPKIAELQEQRNRVQASFWIGVDGGINRETGALAVEAGADFLIAGSAVFRSVSPVQAIRELKELV